MSSDDPSAVGAETAIQIEILNLIISWMLASVIITSDSDIFVKTVSNAIDHHIDRLALPPGFAERARILKDQILSNATTIAAVARQGAPNNTGRQ